MSEEPDEDRPDHGVPAEYDPYLLREDGGEGTQHAFWADRVADHIEDREPDDPVVIKGGISPSGIPHLGNANEIVLGYFVAEVLRERGYEVRQLFTTDDRDPLRGLPRKLADLDGQIVGLGDIDAGALGRNLGKPYTDIPDPFGCCDSYGDHFSTLIAAIADDLDVPIELVSNTDCYEDGRFEAATEFVLENRETARDVLAEYQNKVDEDYVPFNPICEECGKVTETVTDVDVEAGTVSYRCTDMEAGDQTIDGCGHEGTASLREGKLPWRFEWVAQWRELGVDFEPFGKDHAEGSWPSGVDIALNVFDVEPPVPMVYEWFTLDGEPFSSSAGNVVMVPEVLELIEPEVLRYFFARDPTRSRDFSIPRLDQLVDEFDRLEAIYYGEQEPGEDADKAFADRVYPFLVDGEPADERPIRIPFRFAAVLGMTEDPALREEIARREGHIPDDADEDVVADALSRVEQARRWARRTDNAYNYELKRESMPDVEFDANTEAALDELADFIETHDDPEAIQGEIYEIARRHDVDVGDFFAAGYRLFFDQEEGPKLGTFLAKLDEAFVLDRLRRER
ncbi:lysine--tRNA ligase [Natronoarchaeum sp. GCM10025321]|uniref:lysine--tRNA ligase n=1 Tax=Natronoarchaeum sp. GCM10025321 TaxID=3252684 RepID=UPI003612EA14